MYVCIYINMLQYTCYIMSDYRKIQISSMSASVILTCALYLSQSLQMFAAMSRCVDSVFKFAQNLWSINSFNLRTRVYP